MSTPDPLVGHMLGQYQITGLLGKGGMASVYLGYQRSIDREVAVKILPSILLHDPAFMDRFRREASMIAHLEHLHILPIYDYGEEDGRPYLVMRFLGGGTLKERIKEEGPLPWQDVVRIIKQIGSALDYAHSKNIVHRDIKPSNIMLDDAGNSFLVDFGIARMQEAAAGMTGSGIIGTPAYMAPEQSEPGPPTPSIDIYALGCTLFEMISGRVPYEAETPFAQIMAHLQQPTPSLSAAAPGFPKEVDAVLRKAMARQPASRYQTASALAADLEKAATKARGWKWDPATPLPSVTSVDPQTKVLLESEMGAVVIGPPAPEERIPLDLKKLAGAVKGNKLLLYSGGGAVLLAVLVLLVVIIGPLIGGGRGAGGFPSGEHGKLLYDTDFLTGWQAMQTGHATSGFMAQGMRVSVDPNWGFWTPTTDHHQAEFYAEITATVEQCRNPESVYGMIFHFRNNDTFQRFVVSCGGAYMLINRALPADATTIASGKLPGNIDTSTGDHTLGLRVKSNVATMYVDGRRLGTARLDAEPMGEFGPYVESGNSATVIIYNHLTIYQP